MSESEPIGMKEAELAEAIRKARLVFVVGNGGSAATADHFVTDLVKKGIGAVSLCSNAALITMIANDYGYDQIFSRQLEVLGTPEDLLVTISCSGTSPNIEDVLMKAQSRIGMPVYSFDTFSPNDRDYAKLEDEHLAFAHRVAGLL
jgi:D-sedoheptulose 7-phosphate isomerase